MAEPIDFRRIAMGLISLSFISIGMFAVVNQLSAPFYWVLLRSGLFIGAVWLAMPEFTSGKSILSTPLLLLGIAIVLIIATRPKLFLVFGTLAIAAFFLQGAVRRFTRKLKN